MNFRDFIHILRLARSDAPVGDIAAYKLSVFPAPDLEIPPSLLDFPVDTDSLRTSEKGTLGYEYAHFLDQNGLEHLEVSASMRATLRDAPYAIRFSITHDLHHLLAGFDTGVAGEVGVAAFNAGQGTGPFGPLRAKIQAFFVCLIAPFQAAAIWKNTKLGIAMGGDARCVMTTELSSLMSKPLSEVREKLRIRAADLAAIRPSRRSLLIRAMYRLIGRSLPPISQPPRG